MQNILDKYINLMVSDVRVEITDEFDKNFERKRFFTDAPWAPTKRPVKIGSLMLRTGALRSSIISQVQDRRIEFSSDRPYAEIHNKGGVIERTSNKGKSHTINMPQRQFIGHHTAVDDAVEQIVEEHMPELVDEIVTQYFNKNR